MSESSHGSSIELERPRSAGNTQRGLPTIDLTDWRAAMHSTRQCSVEHCDRSDIQAHGMCRMHYHRWRRTGSTVARPLRATRGNCTVDGCGNLDCGPHGLCPKHNSRNRRNGDPLLLMGGPRARFGPENSAWTGDQASYSAMHLRVRGEKGRASLQVCVDCGRVAQQWSYDRSDPDERTSADGPYSVSINHYEARCIPCHKRFDLGAR